MLFFSWIFVFWLVFLFPLLASMTYLNGTIRQVLWNISGDTSQTSETCQGISTKHCFYWSRPKQVANHWFLSLKMDRKSSAYNVLSVRNLNLTSSQ